MAGGYIQLRIKKFQGHDTTAAGLTLCLLTLAENQDAQVMKAFDIVLSYL